MAKLGAEIYFVVVAVFFLLGIIGNWNLLLGLAVPTIAVVALMMISIQSHDD